MGCHPNPIDESSIIFQDGHIATTNQEIQWLIIMLGEGPLSQMPHVWNIWNIDLPSGYVKIAKMAHRNSGFTHWKWWFPIVMPVYQRVHVTQKWASFVGKYSIYGASGYFKPQPCRSRSGNIATTFQRSISDPIVTLLTWRLKITIFNRYFLWNNI